MSQGPLMACPRCQNLTPDTAPVTCWACLGLPLVSEQTPAQPSEGLPSPHLASQGSTRVQTGITTYGRGL